MVVQDRSLGAAPGKGTGKIKLRASFRGKEIMIDRPEDLTIPFGAFAKIEVDRKMNSLAEILIRQGEEPESVQKLITKIAGNNRLDLPALDILFELSARYAPALMHPLAAIDIVAGTLGNSSAKELSRIMLVESLFEMAKKQ
jgi:hypothetical protein